MRLDQYLVTRGLVPSRQKAVYCIKEGLVLVNGTPASKPSLEVEGKEVELLGLAFPYVSRGGLKLLGALRAFAFDLAGLTCLDVGASTGGFTHCLLEQGAKKVYALDVGRDQLHPTLKSDPRVVSIEQFNARDLCADTLPELAVSDLSFISQSLIYDPLKSVMKEGAPFLSLIKPQFEAGRAALSKKGIVTDLKDHLRVIGELQQKAEQTGFLMEDLCRSPIEGGDGNREYIALFRLEGQKGVDEKKIHAVVYDNDR